jgi:hypothetical protein
MLYLPSHIGYKIRLVKKASVGGGSRPLQKKADYTSIPKKNSLTANMHKNWHLMGCGLRFGLKKQCAAQSQKK